MLNTFCSNRYHTITRDDNGCPRVYVVVNSLYMIKMIFMSFSHSYEYPLDKYLWILKYLQISTCKMIYYFFNFFLPKMHY